MSEFSHSDRPGYASDSFGAFSPSGHEDVDTPRKAAEALFAPKTPTLQPTPDSTGSTQQGARKPRILSAIREQPAVIQPHDSQSNKQLLQNKARRLRKRVPASHLARVRTWLKYGMTADQAADMYGVNISEIERLVR